MSYDFVYIYRVGQHIKCIYKLNRNRKDMGIQTMLSILTRFSVKYTLEKHVSITFSHFHYFVTNEHIFKFYEVLNYQVHEIIKYQMSQNGSVCGLG